MTVRDPRLFAALSSNILPASKNLAASSPAGAVVMNMFKHPEKIESIQNSMMSHQYSGHTVQFERMDWPNASDSDVAFACLERLVHPPVVPPSPEVIASAKWHARTGEHQINFEDRIRRDLAAERISGVIVTTYTRADFWHRNARGLIPVAV